MPNDAIHTRKGYPLEKPVISSGPTVLDLFAGAGGFSLGFHWAGFRTRVAIDHNPLAVETLQTNFASDEFLPLHRDLSRFTPEHLRREMKSSGIVPSFDVVIGGPPCQGWSKVGRGKIRSLNSSGDDIVGFTDPRNRLYRRYLDFIRSFKPKVAVMENVPGMLSHKGRNVAENVAESLADLGYRVTWSLLNASHYGVPQERERLIFVGVRKDEGVEFSFPEWKTEKGRRAFPHVTVRDAIGDLPIIRNGAKEWVRPYRRSGKPSAYARFMRSTADKNTIFDHVCRMQNDQDLEAFRLMKQGGKYVDLPKRLKRYRDDIFDDKYKKLYWDRPSWCVTAHLGKDCYTHIHPSQARTISIREAARLQSFPDSFYFAGPMGSKFALIGNAVPPVMSRFIATAVREQVFEVTESAKRKAV